MYPFLRVAYAARAARRLPPMNMFDTHVTKHRAWPQDCDLYGELNHGLMLTVFEMARWQMAVRLGVDRTMQREKIGFAVAGVSVRYRRRIPFMTRYQMHSRFLGWDDRFLYMDQSMCREIRPRTSCCCVARSSVEREQSCLTRLSTSQSWRSKTDPYPIGYPPGLRQMGNAPGPLLSDPSCKLEIPGS